MTEAGVALFPDSPHIFYTKQLGIGPANKSRANLCG